MKDILKLSASNAVSKAPRTTIVADRVWTDGIAKDLWNVVPELQVLPTGRTDALSREQLRDVELLIVEVDAAERATLDRLAAARRMFPDLTIIAAVLNADIQLMRTLLRHGVSDVIALPFHADELTSEIFNVAAKLAESSEVPLAPNFAFVGALGRSGTTSITLHLANALVALSEHPLRCCLIDLDFQSGQLAAHAGIESSRSILSLLEADERLDQDMIRNVATRSSEGVYIISAPTEILPIEQVDVDQLLRIVQMARAQFDLVFLDLPHAWTTWSLSLAAESDHLLLVTEQNLAHLRQAHRCLDLFREVGIEKSKVQVIVNRAVKGRFGSITTQDVSDTLGCQVLATIHEDHGELAQAIDEGKLVSAISRRSVFAADVAALAEHVGAMIEGGAR